jgi:hypothetical protein
MAAWANIVAHDTSKARVLAERLWNRVPQWRSPAAGLLARLGDRERAQIMIRQSADRPDGSENLGASLYLSLGDTARALSALERAAALGYSFPTSYSLSEPDFDSVRQSPRFAAIVRAVRLDERIFTSPNGGRPR